MNVFTDSNPMPCEAGRMIFEKIPPRSPSDAFAMPVRDHCRTLLRDTLRELLPSGTRCALVLYPDHWNAGDAAIWCGTRKLLRELEVEVAYGCDTTSYDARALRLALPEGPILILGGGNFGDVYKPEQSLRHRVLWDHPGRPVIQLPQSIWFCETDAVADLEETMRRHGRCTLLVRDAKSLEFAQKNFSAPARLCPDMVHALDLSELPRQAEVPVVAVWRNDRESSEPPPPLPENSIVGDWTLPDGKLPEEQASRMSLAGLEFHRWVGRLKPGEPCSIRRRLAWKHLPWLWDQLAEDRYLRGCRMLTRGQVTVTNRFHGHLLCWLMGQPHVVRDVCNGKVSAYHETWGCDSHLMRFAETNDEVLDLAMELLPAACS